MSTETMAGLSKIAKEIERVFESGNEIDRAGQNANVVDGLFAIARAIGKLAESVDNMAYVISGK